MPHLILVLGVVLFSLVYSVYEYWEDSQDAVLDEWCGEGRECEEGLECIEDFCSDKSVGKGCLDAEDCLAGLFCFQGACTPPGTLRKSCGPDRPCAWQVTPVVARKAMHEWRVHGIPKRYLRCTRSSLDTIKEQE